MCQKRTTLRSQDKAFDAQEAAAALRRQLEEARLEAGEAAAGALDHTGGAGFQRVWPATLLDLQSLRRRCSPRLCMRPQPRSHTEPVLMTRQMTARGCLPPVQHQRLRLCIMFHLRRVCGVSRTAGWLHDTLDRQSIELPHCAGAASVRSKIRR